ncbi:exported hypothetical protein [Agrobacterium tumefaciens str. B6]|uniref:Uncharacterized protein n=1 Tax=Agrobacterium tumefaciens str. B6 TaxID=1183423 RepID=A0A822V9G4_AGRTU|nr:exported hypothetical protein [Agrobacterium tumefaciens str. B6]
MKSILWMHLFRSKTVSKRTSARALIPVLVTGIQPARVCATERLLSAQGLGLAGSL